MRLGAWVVLAGVAAACAGASSPATGPVPRPEREQPAPPPIREPVALDEETRPAPSGPVPPVVRIPVEAQERIDEVVLDAIARHRMPGAVVVMGRRDGTVFRRAYGQRAVEPAPLPMTLDTVFDLASLTKAVVTTTAIAILVEQGSVALDAPVAQYLPEFAANGKATITVEQLLTHTAGLPPVNPLSDYEDGEEQAVARILAVAPVRRPGTRYEYSDLGFIVLGVLVERVSGQSLDAFAREHVFEPLGMDETVFRPEGELRERCAPTELAEHRDHQIIHGECDDPRAWRLGGVAGNAGLFSTADDLSRFARMMLGGGALGGTRVLSEATVERFTAPRDVGRTHRALGWNAEPDGSYGHGGYTGTSLWIDPHRDLFVLVLSNRVHPNGEGNIHPTVRALRAIAEEIAPEIAPAPPDGVTVLTGIDVLRRDDFELLRGAHVGLITNQSGRARDGMRTLDLLHAAPEVEVVAAFAPEHGLGASQEGRVGNARDARTGVPIYSLFGETRQPTDAQLEGIDTLVFDLQDVGARFFTYMSTMFRAMQVAAAKGLRFVVLDRPNPLGGTRVEGPVLEADLESFVNYHPLPIRHGMTAGELAQRLNEERDLGVRLDVVPVEGWSREMYYDETGLPWVPPSPNLATVEQVVLYPGVALVEGTNVSVGRGTGDAFRVVGAPWADAGALVAHLRSEAPAGVTFETTSFVPRSGPYRGQRCRGVRFTVTDRDAFQPVETGFALVRALHAVHPRQWDPSRLHLMIGSRSVTESLL